MDTKKVADKVARAIVDVLARGDEPTEQEISDAVKFVLDQELENERMEKLDRLAASAMRDGKTGLS